VEAIALHLAEQCSDPLRLGHEVGRSGEVGDGPLLEAVALGSHQLLGVDDTDDVVDPRPGDRQAAEAVEQHDLHGIGHSELGGDGHHVGARHHHFAGDRVTELDDGLDELALVLLDDVLLDREVRHREELLLRGVRPAGEALPRQQHVGEADQGARQEPQRRQRRHEAHGPGRGQGGAVGVLDGPRLRRDLRHDEEQGDVEDGRPHDAPAAEQAAREHAEQRRLHELGGQHDEQHRVEPVLSLDQRQQDLPPPPCGLRQRLGLRP
jgi:hypothetical protein